MTPLQIIALVAIAVIGLATYVFPLVKPWIDKAASLPNHPKNSSMDQVQAVLAIRDSTEDKAVISACNSLLHVLLKVTA